MFVVQYYHLLIFPIFFSTSNPPTISTPNHFVQECMILTVLFQACNNSHIIVVVSPSSTPCIRNRVRSSTQSFLQRWSRDCLLVWPYSGSSSGRGCLFSQAVTTLFRMACLLTSKASSAQVKDLALPDMLQSLGAK
jgi:hypothetical protein